MESIRSLWSSSIRGFMESLELGTEEGICIEVKKLQQQEKIEAKHRDEVDRAGNGKQKQRDEAIVFWTTAGQRPLAEPPIIDWDWFKRKALPSSIRYKLLFPHDKSNRATMQDLDDELQALAMYRSCAWLMRSGSDTGGLRRRFYMDLDDELCKNFRDVYEECEKIYGLTTEVPRFGFKYLDNDGRTAQLESWIQKGANVFRSWVAEVQEKYDYLVPPDFVKNHLATFEFEWLGPNGGTEFIEQALGEERDILAEWPQEVQDKCGHLLVFTPSHSAPDTPSCDPCSIHAEPQANVVDEGFLARLEANGFTIMRI